MARVYVRKYGEHLRTLSNSTLLDEFERCAQRIHSATPASETHQEWLIRIGIARFEIIRRLGEARFS